MKSMMSERCACVRTFFVLKPNRDQGFTLVELMVVLAIIGVLLAVGIPAFNESRSKSRDAKRISDLKQLEFALEVYAEAHGDFPQVATSTVIGEGGPIDEALAPFMGGVPKDPLGSASDDTYEYVYESDSACGVAVYAKTMEREENVNAGATCSDLSGRVVALGGWDIESTGTSQPSNPPLPPGDDSYSSSEPGGGTTGFTVHEYDGHTYYESNDEMSIEAAQDLADQLGGNLVTISSQEENDYISGLTNNYTWIGLYQPNPTSAQEPDQGWEWMSGEPVTYTNWYSGEPNDYRNGSPGEDYAVLNWNGGQWNDWYTWADSGGTDAQFVIEFDYQE